MNISSWYTEAAKDPPSKASTGMLTDTNVDIAVFKTIGNNVFIGIVTSCVWLCCSNYRKMSTGACRVCQKIVYFWRTWHGYGTKSEVWQLRCWGRWAVFRCKFFIQSSFRVKFFWVASGGCCWHLFGCCYFMWVYNGLQFWSWQQAAIV